MMTIQGKICADSMNNLHDEYQPQSGVTVTTDDMDQQTSGTDMTWTSATTCIFK